MIELVCLFCAQEHETRECDFREISCHQCAKLIPCIAMKDHVANKCDHRSVDCDYCYTSVKQFQLEVSSTMTTVVQGQFATSAVTVQGMPPNDSDPLLQHKGYCRFKVSSPDCILHTAMSHMITVLEL